VVGNLGMSKEFQRALSKAQSKAEIPKNNLTQDVPRRCNPIPGILRSVSKSKKAINSLPLKRNCRIISSCKQYLV
jgi:hypothetical protein